jgi:hypothetical protein
VQAAVAVNQQEAQHTHAFLPYIAMLYCTSHCSRLHVHVLGPDLLQCPTFQSLFFKHMQMTHQRSSSTTWLATVRLRPRAAAFRLTSSVITCVAHRTHTDTLSKTDPWIPHTLHFEKSGQCTGCLQAHQQLHLLCGTQDTPIRTAVQWFPHTNAVSTCDEHKADKGMPNRMRRQHFPRWSPSGTL